MAPTEKVNQPLLRIIAGTETFNGERIWGHNVEESFYAQHQLEALNINNTVLEEMKAMRQRENRTGTANFAGLFFI